MVRGFDPERLGILMQQANRALGELGNGLAILNRATNDFVVDVRDVPNVSDLIALTPQPAPNDVKCNQDPGMPDMANVVDGHPTDIQTNVAGFEGDKRFFAASKRVVNSEHVDR